MAFVTLQGIQEAVSNFAPRSGTLQERLLSTLLSYFTTEESLSEITSISSEELVKAIWGADSPEEIRKKKKNLSSLKSAINKRLKELTDLDQNAEGLIIGKDNVFTISEEHKNSLLNKLGISSGSDPAMEFLASMRGLMGDFAEGGNSRRLQAMLSELDKTREIIDQLLQEKDSAGTDPSEEGEGSDGQEDIEEIELEEDEELVVVKKGQQGEGTESGSETGEDSGGATEGIESDEFESEGLYSDIAEDVELVEELLDEEIIEEEEVEEEDNLQDGEGDESSDFFGEAAGAGDTDDAGGQLGSVEGTADQRQGDDVTGLGDLHVGTGQFDGVGPNSTLQDIEVLDDEELVEELLDEEELVEEEIVEEELEEGEGLQEIEGESSQFFDEDDETGSAGEQPGNVEGTEGQGQDGDVTGLGDLNAGTGQSDEGGPDSALQDIEVLEDEELVEELLDEEELIEEEDVVEELLDEEIIEEDEILEECVEEEAIEEFETVEVEDEEIIEVEADSQGQQLDLSRYIEPSEALDNLPETLTEGTDELLNMIMQRFMPPFIQIQAGSYRVGSKNPKSIDRQEQSVILKEYHISQIPVTNDIFDFFIRETGYETDAEKRGHGTVVEGRFSQKTDPETGKASLIINPGVRFQHVEGANWRHPKGPHSSLENKASHPVVQISRRDAIAFASWAGKKLPSEDEWEAAARGLEGRLFPWGDEWKKDNGNFESSQIGDTTQVTHFGKQSMSPFGLLDMLGNVMEWTSSHVTFPGKMDESGPKLYILKGGSWATGGTITAASRFLEADTWSNIIGFRCAV